jgi:hypothetical protein
MLADVETDEGCVVRVWLPVPTTTSVVGET